MSYRLTCIFGFIILGFLCIPSTATAQAPPISPETEQKMAFQNEISIQYMQQHLEVIASDSMNGRDTGSSELRKVSQYLADEYRELGLEPAVGDTGYLQPYKIKSTLTDSISLSISNKKTSRTLIQRTAKPRLPAPFVQLFGGGQPLRGDIIFAGFGINDPAHNVSHLANMDLQNRWVMVYADIPAVVNGDTLVDPALNERSRFQEIIFRKKAMGIIVIGLNENEFNQRSVRQAKNMGKPGSMQLAYRKEQQEPGWSYLAIDNKRAKKLLGLPSDYSLEAHRENLQSHITSFQPVLLPYQLSTKAYSRDSTFTANNVAAVIEGSDPQLKNEYVILSAHHDHLGVGEPDSTGDAIYNGADDDGSGTVALLNIAKALQTAKIQGAGAKRSVILLHVSGEEKGLLGSRYYSDHPEKPIEKTIANINIDMIGRIDERHEQTGESNYAYIIGGDLISSGLDSLISLGNQHSGMIILSDRYNDLQDPNQFYRRSDHWNFGRLGVPFAFFFSGVHEDYHQPSDEISKIRFEKMAMIVRTIYGSVIMLTETNERPEVDNQAFIMTTKLQER